MRRIDRADLRRHGDRIELVIEANAFLHHMVRNIVGSLLPIGRGEQPVGWMAELLAGRDRDVAGPTAPPTGLVFEGPRYPERFAIPSPASDES
jgi:tRNA pseudouridine38-40 synthase